MVSFVDQIISIVSGVTSCATSGSPDDAAEPGYFSTNLVSIPTPLVLASTHMIPSVHRDPRRVDIYTSRCHSPVSLNSRTQLPMFST